MLLDDAIKIRAAKKLKEISMPLIGGGLKIEPEPVAPENKEVKEYKVIKTKSKPKKPRKTRAKKGK